MLATHISSGRWEKGARAELFDVVLLSQQVEAVVSGENFTKALALLELTEDEYRGLVEDFREGRIERSSASRAPKLAAGEVLSKAQILRIFEWVNRFRGEDWRLVAEILDLARLIGADAGDLHAAGMLSARFNYMEVEDWRTILESGATSVSEWGYGRWDSLLFEKHVRGQST